MLHRILVLAAENLYSHFQSHPLLTPPIPQPSDWSVFLHLCLHTGILQGQENHLGVFKNS